MKRKIKEYEKSLRLWNEFESSFLGINFKQSRTWKHFGIQGMENYFEIFLYDFKISHPLNTSQRNRKLFLL